jgi:hypothetical protein
LAIIAAERGRLGAQLGLIGVRRAEWGQAGGVGSGGRIGVRRGGAIGLGIGLVPVR